MSTQATLGNREAHSPSERTTTQRWVVQRRLSTPTALEVAAIVAGMACAVIFCGILIAASGSSVVGAYEALLDGAFGSRGAVYESLVSATPLILTGLAAAVAFNAQVWNIGAEGQLFAGAMGAFFVGDALGGALPRGMAIPLLLIGAMVAGALWAMIAGVLKARFGTNEIIVTVMLNFIIVYLLSYLLSDAWRAEGTFYFQTERLDPSTWLPTFFGSRLHLGFGIAVGAAIALFLLVRRTSFGFEIRGTGANKQVAEYAGISSRAVIVKVMAVSGAVAGLAGAIELAGLHHRLQLDISNQLGFTGIIIALVARLNALGVIVVAIGAGGMLNGATRMQTSESVPAALVDVLMGATLVAVLVAQVAVRYEVRRVSSHD